MQPSNDLDYKSLFTQLIKKQMLVLGPDITLLKARNVTGITVNNNGDVQKIEGDPKVLIQELINQFVALSGMIVKKTMESILASYPGVMGTTSGFGVPTITASSQPSTTTQQSISSKPEISTIEISQEDKKDTKINSVTTQDPSVKLETQKNEDFQSSAGQQVQPTPMTFINMSDAPIAADKNPVRNDPGSESFSSKEIAGLNNALEELSKPTMVSNPQIITNK